MLKGLCHGCFLHFLYYANYASPWSHRFFLKFFGFATEGANREAATTSRDYNLSFKQFQVKQTENSSASRKREQAGKRRQRVAIVIVSFRQFQGKLTEISWKSSKSGGTQPCNTREWDLNLTPVSLLAAVVTMTIALVFTCSVSCELGC